MLFIFSHGSKFYPTEMGDTNENERVAFPGSVYIHLKVPKGKCVHFRGSISVIFFLVFQLNGSQLLKERICSSRSKFFPLRVGSFLDVIFTTGKHMESQKFFSFKKWGKT